MENRGELIKQYQNGERDFVDADLRFADLRFADLRGADLSDANLRDANLSDANLSDANLRFADLRGADLSDANLRDANLSDANLNCAILRLANLSGANLSGANLSGADLRLTNLSGTTGLLDPAQWMYDNFEFTDKGVIVYKTFNKHYLPPSHWVIEAGSVITETVNPDRCTSCGSGINFAHREWFNFNHGDLWKCLIEWIDLAGVIVPYNTDGKVRCSRMTLLEIVNNDDR